MKIVVILLFLVLAGCGGETAARTDKKADNPLAAQQQLIKDAKSVQGILDKDAEAKKKALADSN